MDANAMDQGTLQGIATILAMLAFAGVVWWVLRKDKKQDFEEAANLPFEDGELEATQNALPQDDLPQDKEEKRQDPL